MKCRVMIYEHIEFSSDMSTLNLNTMTRVQFDIDDPGLIIDDSDMSFFSNVYIIMRSITCLSITYKEITRVIHN